MLYNETELKTDLNYAIPKFIEQGYSKREALLRFLESRHDLGTIRLDMFHSIVLEVYIHSEMGDKGYMKDEEGGYYANDRNWIAKSVSDDLDKSEAYVYNQIYKLRNEGYLDTRVTVLDRKRVTLVTLTPLGLTFIESMIEGLDSLLQETITTTISSIDNNIK